MSESRLGFTSTLRITPLWVVIVVDLLDLIFDTLAAPVVWFLLDRMNLKALRLLATVEAIVPFTQFIPTLTICWVLVNVFDVNLWE